MRGIGNVDAAFMKKSRKRLQELVERSGILVFASHSNEFLAQLVIARCGSITADPAGGRDRGGRRGP